MFISHEKRSKRQEKVVRGGSLGGPDPLPFAFPRCDFGDYSAGSAKLLSSAGARTLLVFRVISIWHAPDPCYTSKNPGKL